jgi:pSer/pThr/pTyr-binding forkhead associated (FHA) protein
MSSIIYQVRVTSAASESLINYVTQERFDIGSSPHLPVVIREPSVEKTHLTVSCVDNQIWLTDRRSMHGTNVEGKKIATDTPVQYAPGDKIKLGSTQITIQIRMFTEVSDALLEPIRAKGRKQADEIVREAKVQSETLIKSAQKAAQDKAETLKTKILEDVRTEAQAKADARAEEEAAHILADAHREANRIIEEARETEKAIQREAEGDAQKLVADAEADAVARIRDRETKAQAAQSQAQKRAQEIVADASEQAVRILQEAKVKAAQERTQEISGVLSRASAQAEAMTKTARDEAEKILETARVKATEKADAAIEQRKADAEKIVATAHTAAGEIKTRARAEADEMVSKARVEIAELREKAEKESERLVEEARTQAAGEIDRANKETHEINRKAQALEEESRNHITTELEARRTEFEAELDGLRKSELDRIGKVWEIQARMAENRRQHDIDLLTKNLELGLPLLFQGFGKDDLKTDEWSRIFQEVQGIVTRSFPSTARRKDRGSWLTAFFPFKRREIEEKEP